MLTIGVIQGDNFSLAHEVIPAVTQAGMQVVDVRFDALLSLDGLVILSDIPRDQYLGLQEYNTLGKPILALDAGVSVLTASGIVPGLEDNKVGLTVESYAGKEASMRLAANYQWNAFTRHLKPQDILSVFSPALRFNIPPALKFELTMQGLDVLYYCNTEGGETVAAIANKQGNALALLSCPKPIDALFFSMREYLAAGLLIPVEPLHYWPRQ